MLNDYSLRQIGLQYESDRNRLIRFLEQHALRFEQDVDTAFGIFSFDDVLVGCGCAAGPLLKCFAVDEALHGQNALGRLVSALIQDRFAHGFYNLFAITRARNEPLFVNCGLYPVVRTESLAMLENCRNGPQTFAESFLCQEDLTKTVGAVVMNANPFTAGHRYLIEYASAHCDVLHIFVVEEDRSFFPTDVRFQLVLRGTQDLPNVRVHLSGHYMISAATFPTYFLKADEDAASLQAELDIQLFAESIAPVLHITRRFAGAEPLDPLTARYNDAMRRILPAHGIEFVEIPRYASDGRIVSASLVRRGLQSKESFSEVKSMLPESTRQYIENNMW